MKRLFHFSCLLVCFFSLYAEAEQIRLLVSAGSLSQERLPFYNSRVFVGEDVAPFSVVAIKTAWVSSSRVFYSPLGITKEELAKPSTLVERAKSISGFIAQSFRGFSLTERLPVAVERYLGVGMTATTVERRQIDGKDFYVFKSDENKNHLDDNLIEMPMALIKDDKGIEHIVVARSVGALRNTLGLVDALFKKDPINTAYVDLGTNHGESHPIAKAKIEAIQKRKPSAVFSGSFEMASLIAKTPELLDLPMVMPFVGKGHLPRQIGNNKRIDFWSVTGNEKLWPLFQNLGKRVTIGDAITSMKAVHDDPIKYLNIVRVFSDEAANEVARSGNVVDLVLLLAKDPWSHLLDEEVQKSKDKAYAHVAPIVKVSYLDVTEVEIFSLPTGIVEKVIIKRHPISDRSPEAKDVFLEEKNVRASGLLDRAAYGEKGLPWRAPDLERIVGGISLLSFNADIAIFDKNPLTTPIYGPIPKDMAQQLLSPTGNMVKLVISGKQIKTIIKNNNSLAFNKKFAVYGIDEKRGMIGGRAISDNEKFTVSLSESALLDIFGLGMLGGLPETYAIRAPFVEAIYGDMNSLYFIGGPKIIAISDTMEGITRAVEGVHYARSFHNMIETFFGTNHDERRVASFLSFPAGRPHHVLTFDLTYFDIGLSTNVTNALYDYHQSQKTLPMGRGNVPKFTHLFLFTKASLNYDAPQFQTSLFTEIKYMHTQLDGKPEKDKTKIGLKFRLPWERSFFVDSSIVVAPILKTIYETKLTPHFWSNNSKLPPRTKRIDTLLGFNADFTKLGFNVDFGAVMATNFRSSSATNALDFGPGINFFSRWPLFGPLELSTDITSYYLFPLPKNTETRKLAFGLEGTVWLRLLRFHDLSLAALSDYLIVTLQDSPKKFAISSIFGLTISYGRLFRLIG